MTDSEHVPLWAKTFTQLPIAVDLSLDCSRFLADRLRVLGKTDSGLFEFYAHKVQVGYVFSNYDVRLAHFCATHLRAYEAFVEIGCESGQLPFLLAQLSMRSYDLEGDAKRFACVRELKAHLSLTYPAIARDAHLQLNMFPATLSDIDISRSVFIANCLACEHTPQEAVTFVRAMRMFGVALIDVTRFLKLRRNEIDRQDLLSLLDREGFAPPVSLGPINEWDGEFVMLFKRT